MRRGVANIWRGRINKPPPLSNQKGNSMLKNLLLSATAALALLGLVDKAKATEGVNDYVTCVRAGAGYPNAIQFQTANGGGDTTDHTCLSSGAAWFCIGTGTGTNALGSAVAAEALAAVINSRWAGSSFGPHIQFTDQGPGYYGDCPSAAHGVSQLDQ
jgi:hypothetical protein